MLKRFESNIAEKQLFSRKDRLLLAISGGVDSVVLAHLLKESGFDFSMAHCNFQLREKDSLKDEAFCKALAKQLGIEFYVKRFDVAGYKDKHKQSTQMAARNLRYDWFNELLKKHKSDYIITAHHAGDTVETVLINLLRGTGIKGLKGIPEKNGAIVRPLLPFTKEELMHYAKKHSITFRQDKSNLEDTYDRNFLRLNVIPELKKLNPELERAFLENSFRFTQEEGIVTDYFEGKIKQLSHKKAGSAFIDKTKIQQEKYSESLLHYLLSPYGFNATQQQNILNHIHSNGTIGKQFQSQDHRLTITKQELVIKPVSDLNTESITIHSPAELKKQPLFKVENLRSFQLPAKHELIVNTKHLIFPLTLRTRQTGDKFKPFGMKGAKLVSDLLKEEKLNAFEKEECRLLINGNGEIIWIVGYRSDDRYKVNKTDSDLLKLTAIE